MSLSRVLTLFVQKLKNLYVRGYGADSGGKYTVTILLPWLTPEEALDSPGVARHFPLERFWSCFSFFCVFLPLHEVMTGVFFPV